MSKQPTIPFERERLHRATMQAYARAEGLERRLRDERRPLGVEPLLDLWLDAALGVRAVLAQKRASLLEDGNAAAHVDRVDQRLAGLVAQADEFVLADDLDTGSASWQHLAHEVSSLSGPGGDALQRFVVSRKDEVDDALEGLARMRATSPLDAGQRRRIRELQEERRGAAERYETLREEYLAAKGPAVGPPPPARFHLPLLHLLRESRFERLASPDHRFVEVDPRLAGDVTGRIDRTLASLSTAGHHRLTDPLVARFRRHVAGLDGAVARLKEAPAAHRLAERRELFVLLRRLGDVASAPGAERHLEPFRKLVEERRAEVARIAGAVRPVVPGKDLVERGALHRTLPAGERDLQQLRRLHPGLAKLLREVPDSPIAAAVRRQYDVTSLERLRLLGPPLQVEIPEPFVAGRPARPAGEGAHRPAHPERIEPAPQHEPPPQPEMSAEPSPPERVEHHLVAAKVPAEVPPLPTMEPKPAPLLVPPLPSPWAELDENAELPGLEEETAFPESQELVQNWPRHGLANIAHLQLIAARRRREVRRDEEAATPPAFPPAATIIEPELAEPPAPLSSLAPVPSPAPAPPLVVAPPRAPRFVAPTISTVPPPMPTLLPFLPRLPLAPTQLLPLISLLPNLPLEVLFGAKPFQPPGAGKEVEVGQRLSIEGVPTHGAAPEDPVLEAFRDGGGSRIYLDGGARRGDLDVFHDDDSDPDAVDTWIGAGEGVKLFSEVFGPFLPAESVSPMPPVDRKKEAQPSGFFAKLVHRVEDFAGQAAKRAAQTGGRFVANAVRGEKTPAGALRALGRAVAGEMHGAAAMAEGFLRGFHLDSAASLAHRVASAMPAKPEETGGSLDDSRRLDASTLHRMEGFLQGDFGGVRVHTGKGAEEITGRYGAEAVTVTDHIFFAPGKFNPGTPEGEKLIAHELTHVLQKERRNLDVRTAEAEALRAERSYGKPPPMETLDLRRPAPDFKFAEFSAGEDAGKAPGVHTAKRTKSRRDDAGGKDEMPDGDEFLEKVSGRVYELLMEELEESFESR